ncbi:MAG TPA: NAD(P)-dependent oxidoreductase [Thermoanaerobacterales bacterium]|jgi:nucleoside-diphosphate-sugar epimerase|nr:NAD(P)-dependent oxidoreductase [Thermoanaerobacterales bacterium]
MFDNQVLIDDIKMLGCHNLWQKLSGRTLLITGATGMLGSYLALAANEANIYGGYGIKLILLGRNSKKAKLLFDSINCKIISQDIREPLNINEPVHYIMHTAGPVGPKIFDNDPLDVISANVEGTFSLLRYAMQYECQSIAYASTHEVYGKVDGEQTEASMSGVVDTTNPRSSYVLAKQTTENILSCFSKQYGIKTSSARLSRLYGPLMNLSSGLFVCDFIKDAIQRKPVRVRGDLNLIRPLCYITDAAKAMLHILINAKMGEAYNVQGDELPTIGEIADLISSIGGCPVQENKPETREYQRSGHWLNTDKLRELKWQQDVKLFDGLKRTYEYFIQAGGSE